MEKITLIISLFLLPVVFLSGQRQWTQVVSKGNLEVYKKDDPNSSLKEIKVIGKIKCDISEMIYALENVNMQKKWVVRAADAKIVDDSQSPEKTIYYMRVDMPFPVSDRDAVVEYRRKQNPNTLVVETESRALQDGYRKPWGVERLPVFDANYTISPKSNGQIEIVSYSRIDPGGLLPLAMVNLAVDKGPLIFMQRIFGLIRSGQCKNKNVAGITNQTYE